MSEQLNNLVSIRSQLVEEMLSYLELVTQQATKLTAEFPANTHFTFEALWQDIHVCNDITDLNKWGANQKKRARKIGKYVNNAYWENKLPVGSIENSHLPFTTWNQYRQNKERNHKTLVLGRRGSGKTWLLQKEALLIAQTATNDLESQSRNINDIDFPIFLDFSEITDAISQGASLEAAFLEPIYQNKSDKFRKFVDGIIHTSRTIILLDGLYQIPASEKTQKINKAVEVFCQNYKKPNLILSSIDDSFLNLTLLGFHTVHLLEFDTAQLESYVKNVMGEEKADSFLSRLRKNPKKFDGAHDPKQLAWLCQGVLEGHEEILHDENNSSQSKSSSSLRKRIRNFFQTILQSSPNENNINFFQANFNYYSFQWRRNSTLKILRETRIDPAINNEHSTLPKIELELVNVPGAIEKPAGDQNILPGQSIHDLFADANQLLLLGAPGSGKTFSLILLANGLVEKALENPKEPLPILLNLSSWQDNDSLIDWLDERLHDTQEDYPFISDIRTWISFDNLTFLLTGLHEVAEPYRRSCVVAINDFKKQFPVSLVVECRTSDYEQIGELLELRKVVKIEPLTLRQIEHVLPFQQFERLKTILEQNKFFHELIKYPKMMQIVKALLQGDEKSYINDQQIPGNFNALYDEFVGFVFQDQPLEKEISYSMDDACQWLAGLAYIIQNQNPSRFFLQNLQPSWLPTNSAIHLYKMINGLFFGAIGLSLSLLSSPGLALWGLILYLWLNKVPKLIKRVIIIFLIYWVFNQTGTILNEISGPLLWSISSLYPDPIIFRESFPLYKKLLQRLMLSTFTGSLFSLTIGFLSGLLAGLNKFNLFQHGAISVQRFDQQIQNQFIERSVKIIIQLIDPIYPILLSSFFIFIVVTIFVGLFATSILVYLSFISYMFTIKNIPDFSLTENYQPNQVIRIAKRNMFLGGISGILIALIIMGTTPRLIISGATLGIVYLGGASLLRHYTLRYILAKDRILPFPFREERLFSFLNEMSNRNLLRNERGSWSFLDNSLRDYFAAKYASASQSSQTKVTSL